MTPLRPRDSTPGIVDIEDWLRAEEAAQAKDTVTKSSAREENWTSSSASAFQNGGILPPGVDTVLGSTNWIGTLLGTYIL